VLKIKPFALSIENKTFFFDFPGMRLNWTSILPWVKGDTIKLCLTFSENACKCLCTFCCARRRAANLGEKLIENFYQLLRFLWAFYLYAACLPVAFCILPRALCSLPASRSPMSMAAMWPCWKTRGCIWI